jgi:hypothetical protein
MTIEARGIETALAPPAPREQSVSAFSHIEVMNDLDTGQPMLLASTNPSADLGDLQVVTAEQALAMVTKQHHELHEGALLALAYEAHARKTRTAPGHFPWCEPGSCVTYDSGDGPVNEHHSGSATIQAPDGFQAAKGRILHACLIADDSFVGSTPAVSAIDATGNGTLLGADALDELIDETTAALDRLRAMRLHMKAAQA